VLRYLGDLSEPEVAQRLGISIGSVKTHLRRAKENLRAQIAFGVMGGDA
jgi:DNA-directed RNA polymerase specialized sigma24 family protein